VFPVIVSTKLHGVTTLNAIVFYARVKNNGLFKKIRMSAYKVAISALPTEMCFEIERKTIETHVTLRAEGNPLKT
jgi:hypothetical protein